MDNICGYTATVSGLSSGAFMAVQYHVAHSSSVIGAGIVSGGPYYCALNNYFVATSSCMQNPNLINNLILETDTIAFASTKLIDPVSNLANSNILIWHGLNDTAIVKGVSDKLYKYYKYFLSPSNEIKYINNFHTVHTMGTNFYGNPIHVMFNPLC